MTLLKTDTTEPVNHVPHTHRMVTKNFYKSNFPDKISAFWYDHMYPDTITECCATFDDVKHSVNVENTNDVRALKTLVQHTGALIRYIWTK